ncbi:MAG: hypothetical protein ACK5LY_01120, partial [Lachnospirales bacterium]
MTENVKNERMGAVMTQLNLDKCLVEHTEYNINSWFAFGRFQADDTMLDYLFHIMQLEFPKLMGGRKYQVVITILNEVTGEYYAKDYLFKSSEVTVNLDKFYLKVPNGLMEGTFDNMHLVIDEKPAGFKLDTTVKAIHYPLVSGGTSV